MRCTAGCFSKATIVQYVFQRGCMSAVSAKVYLGKDSLHGRVHSIGVGQGAVAAHTRLQLLRLLAHSQEGETDVAVRLHSRRTIGDPDGPRCWTPCLSTLQVLMRDF